LEVFNFLSRIKHKEKRSVLIDTHKWKIILRWLPKPFGFEEILAKKLQMLGAQDVEQGVRMVSFKGIKDLCTKLICHCVPL
jgi:hypothetical protein